MACRGVHFALTPSQEEQLLTAADDEAVIDVVQEEIEVEWDEDWLSETDKAWDAIHRCLTDGTLTYAESTPRHWCILGGRQLCSRNDYTVSYLTAEQVRLASQAIQPVTEEELRQNYFRLSVEWPLSEEDFEYTWENFEAMRGFFERAAEAGRAVIFTVDT